MISSYIVINKNLAANNIAIIVTTISFLLYFPVNNEIKTYAIAPTPIPFEIEYDKHMMITVKNAGTAEVTSFISMFAKPFIISTPT